MIGTMQASRELVEEMASLCRVARNVLIVVSGSVIIWTLVAIRMLTAGM